MAVQSDILDELRENFRAMENLISEQNFKIGDAQKFLERYHNVAIKMEQLIISRDNWKKKYQDEINKKSEGKI